MIKNTRKTKECVAIRIFVERTSVHTTLFRRRKVATAKLVFYEIFDDGTTKRVSDAAVMNGDTIDLDWGKLTTAAKQTLDMPLES